jgi:hypothetical protein
VQTISSTADVRPLGDMRRPFERDRLESGYYAAFVPDPDGNNMEAVVRDS